MDDAPPDWDAREQGGVWEINVQPLRPAVPASLPETTRNELNQYNQQQQQYASGATQASRAGGFGGFGSAGLALGRAFSPIFGDHPPNVSQPGRSFDVTETGHRSDEGRKQSLVSTNL